MSGLKQELGLAQGVGLVASSTIITTLPPSGTASSSFSAP